MTRISTILIASTSLVLLSLQQARATVTPTLTSVSGSYSYDDNGHSGYFTGLPGSFTHTDTSASFLIQDDLYPAPAISLFVADSTNEGNAVEHLGYQFAIVSTYKTPTPIDVYYTIMIDPESLDANSPYFADTGELIVRAGATAIVDDSESSVTNDAFFTESKVAQLDAVSGQPYDVELIAGVNALPGGTGAVAIDPVIAIDPGFLASHPGVELYVSANVGNSEGVSAAPEPSSWVLIVSGVGGVGLMLRRKKSRPPTLESETPSTFDVSSGRAKRPLGSGYLLACGDVRRLSNVHCRNGSSRPDGTRNWRLESLD